MKTVDVSLLPTNSVKATAAKIRRIGENARKVFIEREDLIHAIECGMCSGEHVIILGKPGTSKSALARYFSECMSLKFFRTVLNPDTVREEILGPMSATAMMEDRWERKWAAVATADIALCDEIGKASSQVQNMLLDIMEERKARSADVEIDIPLHMLIAGTNETLEYDAEAVWDRFTIRVIVEYIRSANSFAELLDVNTEEREYIPVTREELVAIRQKAHKMATSVSEPVRRAMVELWSEIPNQTPEPVSDRRWKKLLNVAAGRAILNGRSEIHEEDLIVGKWILWSDIDHHKQIEKWLMEKVNRDEQAYLDTKALLNEIEGDVMSRYKTYSLSQKMEVMVRLEHLANTVKSRHNLSDKRWIEILRRVDELTDQLGGN